MTDELLRAAMESIRKQGSCAFCGDTYAAHRAIDAQMAMFEGADTLETTARDYGLSVDEMLARWVALAILRAQII